MSPRKVGPTKASRCSSVPWARIVGSAHSPITIVRLVQAGPLEFLGDHDLGDRARLDAVRARVVRGRQPALGQEAAPLPGVQGRRLGQRLGRPGPQPRGLVLQPQVVAALGGRGQLGQAPLPRPARAEQRGQAHRAPPVQVGVVLPGVADAAEQRHRVQADVDGGRRRDHRRRGGGQRELPGVLPVRDGGVPGGRGDQLGAGEQPGALVLDRLERADRAAELLAHLGVGQTGLLAPAGDAGRLRREQRRRPGRGPGRVDDEELISRRSAGRRAGSGRRRGSGRRARPGSTRTSVTLARVEDEPDGLGRGVPAVGLGAEHQDPRAGGAEDRRRSRPLTRHPAPSLTADSPVVADGAAAVAPDARSGRSRRASGSGACSAISWPARTVGSSGPGNRPKAACSRTTASSTRPAPSPPGPFRQVDGVQALPDERLPGRLQLARGDLVEGGARRR